MLKIIFVTSSPRRIELLGKFNIKVDIVKPKFEPQVSFKDPCKTATMKAKGKIQSTLPKIPQDSIVIAADTVVYAEGRIIEKPRNERDAIKMLKRLSGKTHYVITALVFASSDKVVTKCVKTMVSFKKLSMKEIIWYIKTKEPMDKAGAYAIQGYGALFVKRIKGDYYNVLGLPLNTIYTVLKNEFNVNLLEAINIPKRNV